MKRELWILFALVVVWYLWNEGDGDLLDGVRVSINEIQRGRRVTKCPYNKETGVVPCNPATLADQAHVDLDTYALARMLSSEEGNSSNAIRVAVCWAVRNHAARYGKTIPSLLLRANNPAHTGKFGTQRDIDKSSPNFNKSDRYASTANDPYEGDLEIAVLVLLDAIPDPTGGADQFDRPAGEADPVRVANNRMNAGQVPKFVEGINADEIRFWGAA